MTPRAILLVISTLLLAASGNAGAAVVAQDRISDVQGLPPTLLEHDDHFGVSVAAIGDLDMDGTNDLAVGARHDDDGGTNCGAVYILFLDTGGAVKSYRKISRSTECFAGSLAGGDRFGTSVASLGDLDGDGNADIGVGAPGDDGSGSESGALWILFLNMDGSVKSYSRIAAGQSGFTGPLSGGDQFGASVSTIGPLDADGVVDIAVGANGGTYGSSWILFMNTDGTVKAEQQLTDGVGNFPGGLLASGDGFGWGVTGIDDVNGDAIPDIAVGAPMSDTGGSDRGSVWIVFLDTDGTVQTTPAPREIASGTGGFTGSLDDGDVFGTMVSRLGDLDGDGRSELAVGAPEDDDGLLDAGAIYILYPNADGTVKSSHVKISATGGGFGGALQNGDGFGRSGAALGDFDGDTNVEIVVGANLDDDGSGCEDCGAVWILDLDASETAVSEFIVSNTEGGLVPSYFDDSDFFASSIANLGDMDGNGGTDYAVGAGRDDDGGPNRGAVWLLFRDGQGAVTRVGKISDIDGCFAGALDDQDNFGQSVENIGDVDNDGIDDIAVGARGDDDGGLSAGAIWILFLNADGTVRTENKISTGSPGFTGTFSPGNEIGWSIAGLGDIDADNVPDIAVGSPSGNVWIMRLNTDGTVKAHNRIDASEPLLTVQGVDFSDLFGSGLAAIGDLDGNGVPDLAVGSGFEDVGGNNTGAVYILFLSSTGTINSVQKIAEGVGGFTGPLENDDEFGRGVGALGDIDGNGTCDIVVGANFDDGAGTDRGSAWVLFLDATGTVVKEEKIADGTGGFTGILADDDRFGTSVEGGGSIPGEDCLYEIAVGAPRADDGGPGRGVLWILQYSTGPSTNTSQPAIARFLAPNQDKPETHIPDFAPPPSGLSLGLQEYVLHEQDFEGLNNWTTVVYGNGFVSLHSGTGVVQEDPTPNSSQFYGFFDPGPAPSTNYACGGWPGQGAVPFVDAFDNYAHAAIVSPAVDWNTDTNSNSVPSAATEAYIVFDVYLDLPLDNLVFYYWRVRFLDGSQDPIVTGSSDANGWMTDNFVYYGATREWEQRRFPIGGLVPTSPAPDFVQVEIGVRDMCEFWCGIFGTGACHSHAPLVDNVEIYRFDPPSLWEVNPAHLFQDNFAGDGTLTGPVRMDMAMDIAPSTSSVVQPGDSAVVRVVEPVNGIGIDPVNGGAAVYGHFKDIPGGKSGAAISGDLSRWPLVSQSGGWTILRFDSVYCDGRAVPDRYCVDLNDSLYTPGDTVWYYFSTTDGTGNDSFWNEFTGVGLSESEAMRFAMEVTALPANGLAAGSDILYVDAVDGGGVEPFYEWAFKVLGARHRVDRYDMRGPTQVVNNGLSTRVSDRATQIDAVYRKIIWDAGDLPVGAVPDQSPLHNKADDFALLADFVNNLTDSGGLFLAGDDLPQYWNDSGSPGAATLRGFLDYSMVTDDHRAIGEHKYPLLIGAPGSCFDGIIGPDTLIAWGGGTYLNHFDVMTPGAGATVEMTYSDDPSRGAVVGQRTVNSMGAEVGVMLAGFSARYIREDHPAQYLDRSEFVLDLCAWLENILDNPVPTRPTGPKNQLAQNYPNPFNPSTTIPFSIARPGHVRISVYDVSGRLVRALVDEYRRADTYVTEWDGMNDGGEQVASGVYFYRLSVPGFIKTRKLVVLK